MRREADFAIQGFLYQFHKTLAVILQAEDDAIITVEGVIEDIDIAEGNQITAIQVKYHESADNFLLSTVYKPVLQMMDHFRRNPLANIQYRLYAHFSSELPRTGSLTKAQLEEILATKNKDLAKLANLIAGQIDLTVFLSRFEITFGKALNDLLQEVTDAFVARGIQREDLEHFITPNAIHHIATLSIQHEEAKRRITPKALLALLTEARKTVISRWTLLLKSSKQLLQERRKQLSSNLAKNVRLRYFLFSATTVQDFEEGIVIFIDEYLERYHSKALHTETPTFFFDCGEPLFEAFRDRLYQKGVKASDGFVGSKFYRDKLLEAPVAHISRDGRVQRSFSLRIALYSRDKNAIMQPKPHDLFIISTAEYLTASQDDNIERLEVNNLNQLKFLMGMTNAIS